MLGSTNIWDTARRCDEALRQHGLPYAIVGGVAVCLHGYQRTTIGLDILVSHADTQAVRAALEAAGFEWHAVAVCAFSRRDKPDGVLSETTHLTHTLFFKDRHDRSF